MPAVRGGKFADIEQFLTSVNPRIANRKAMESLIKAGAFDRFGDRSQLFHNLDTMLAYASRVQRDANSGQTDLFGNVLEDSSALKPRLVLEAASTTFSMHDQLLWERELLGLYLSRHPLDAFETILGEQTSPLSELQAEHDGKAVTIGGAITDVREITTKNGQKMAFVKLEDTSGEIEIILFPNSYQQTVGLWERDRIMLIRGKVSAKDRDGNLTQELKILVDDAREITHDQASAYQATGRKKKSPKAKVKAGAEPAMKGPGARAALDTATAPERIYIRLADSADHTTLLSLKQAIDEHKGLTEVVLVLGGEASQQVIKLPSGINNIQPVLARLESLVGSDNLRVR